MGTVCAPAALNTTVLVAFNVPNVGLLVLVLVSVAFALTSTVPETAKPDGMVKLQAFVPSPITILELEPETVQAAPMVGVALFLILKT